MVSGAWPRGATLGGAVAAGVPLNAPFPLLRPQAPPGLDGLPAQILDAPAALLRPGLRAHGPPLLRPIGQPVLHRLLTSRLWISRRRRSLFSARRLPGGHSLLVPLGEALGGYTALPSS